MPTDVNRNAPWLFQKPNGWYHADETDDLVGPFETEERASAALDAHMAALVMDADPARDHYDPTEDYPEEYEAE